VAAIPIQFVAEPVGAVGEVAAAVAWETVGVAKSGTKPATVSVATATAKTRIRTWNVLSML
jgi:hypothetical protein